MANLHVRNVPQDLYQRLRLHARESNTTMSAVMLAALERELAMRDWQARFAERPKTDIGVAAATLLEKERSLRDVETG